MHTDYDHTPIQSVEPLPIQPVKSVIGLTEEEQTQREEDPNLTINELLGLSSCEGHVTTPLQMLDGQHMNQPSRFLPLVQEAGKLAKKIRQEEDKLYYLAENCADRYYVSVIKTFIENIKCSVTDHQIILVNTARALKYPEDFGKWQSQLYTVLEKYHLPDILVNLQSQFRFLKKATSKNIEHLQHAINVQQNCAATICTYINNILPCINKLKQTVLKLQKQITTDHDRVQLKTMIQT